MSAHTESVLSSIDLPAKQINNIEKLDLNKAHGHDKYTYVKEVRYKITLNFPELFTIGKYVKNQV